MTSLLIVDSQVVQYEKIIAAKKGKSIVFDSKVDTLEDIVSKVSALSDHVFDTVGLVQEGNSFMTHYRIVVKQNPCELNDLPTVGLSSWDAFVDFIKSIQTITGMKTLDFISCSLYANKGFAYAMDEIAKQTGIELRASTDNTGNVENGGNWIQESANVDIRDVYFTDAISEFTGLLYNFSSYGTNTKSMVTTRNPGHNMVGYVGLNNTAGFTNAVDRDNVDASGVRATIGETIVPLAGQVLSWGDPSGSRYAPDPSGIAFTTIIAANDSFSAIDVCGNVAYWGIKRNNPPTGPKFVAIAASLLSFAGLDTSGNIYTWGAITTAPPLNRKYICIAVANETFAAIDGSGNIFAWGDIHYGGLGDITGVSNAVALCSTSTTFAALLANGSIYYWGRFSPDAGEAVDLSGTITGNFKNIVSNNYSYAAIDISGNIQCFGYSYAGGFLFGNTKTVRTIQGNFTAIASNFSAFAALDVSGNITAWGNTTMGGNTVIDYDTSYRTDISANNYQAIVPSLFAYTALDVSGHMISWGDPRSGGNLSGNYRYFNTKKYLNIAASAYAFASLDISGGVQSWGYLWENYNQQPSTTPFPDPTPSADKFTYIIGGANVFAGVQATTRGNKLYSWGFASDVSGAPTSAGWNTVVASAHAFGAIKSPVKGLSLTPIFQYSAGGSAINIFSDVAQFAGDSLTIQYDISGEVGSHTYYQTVNSITGDYPTNLYSNRQYINITIVESTTGRYTYIPNISVVSIVPVIVTLSVNPNVAWGGLSSKANIFYNVAQIKNDATLTINWQYFNPSVENPTIYTYTQQGTTLNGNAPSDPSGARITGPGSLPGYQVNSIGSSDNAFSYQASTQFFTILPEGILCFLQDSEILTKDGYVKVQDLRRGDLVKTASGKFIPIFKIVADVVYNPASTERIKDQLYVCRKDKYPELTKDLVITGAHSILVDKFKEGEEAKAVQLFGDVFITGNKYRLPACVDERTRVYEKTGPATIYHFALENESRFKNYGVFANGLLVETCSIRYITELCNMMSL